MSLVDHTKSAKPVLGPKWRKGLTSSSTCVDAAGETWIVTQIDPEGRDAHWSGPDGRVARTSVTPDHPDYPPDLTREQQRDLARLAKEAKKAVGYMGWIP